MRTKIFTILILIFITAVVYLLVNFESEPSDGTVILGASAEAVSSKFDKADKIKAEYQLDNTELVLDKVKNEEKDKYTGEPKDEIKVVVGDNKEGMLGADKNTFTPNIELSRWNEVSFKLKADNLLTDVDVKDKSLDFADDRIKFTSPKMDFEMYAPDDENYKYVWYLNEKPKSNIVEFQIESDGLDFFYQPPLTEEYKDGYNEEFERDIIVTETQVRDKDGNVLVERPENVVGSYAVYHSTKGGMVDINGKDYKTGKAFHIYRPHIIDAKGNETWGILHIANGIYSVEIPQGFLDKAVYPIKSNDTFGYTGNAGTQYYIALTDMWGMQETTSGGTVTKVSIYSMQPSGSNYKGIIINSSKNIVTNGVTNAIAVPKTPVAWKDSTFTSDPTITAGTNYVGAVGGPTNKIAMYYDSGSYSNNYFYDSSNSYATPTNPTDLTGGSNLRFSIYATYTPSGGEETPTISEESDIIFID